MAGLDIQRVGTSLGAIIGGIDLTQPVTEAHAAALRQALLDHQVIFFRNQNLTGEQFKAVGQVFGKAYPHFVLKNLGGDLKEVTQIYNDGSRQCSPTIDNKIQWHADGGYYEQPTEATLLLAKELPPYGGDTLFTSMYDAYDMLHPALRRAVDELQAVHSFPDVSSKTVQAFNANISDDPTMRVDPGSVAGRLQPLVVVHPQTGRKTLNINRQFTRQIVGMPEIQARHLFDLLVEHCTSYHEFQVRFQWQVGSLAIWDNRCTLHRAIADFSTPRMMWRLTIAGTNRLHGPQLEAPPAALPQATVSGSPRLQ